VSVAENAAAVTTIVATDADDGAVLSYAITGGADAARFRINTSTGVLTFAEAPNFEAPADVGGNNVYDVVVQVSDGTRTDTQALAVRVTNSTAGVIIVGTNADDNIGPELTTPGQAAPTEENDHISGAPGNDTLNGGPGADTLIGGMGDDTYVVDNADDTVTENASEGTDLVQSTISHVLGTNVENLTLTGIAAISGTGNALDNLISGNASNNILDGGAGADTLQGGAGNDTYVVDHAGDAVTEIASQGIDLVQSSLTCALNANVENLTLTGSAAIDGTGNALNNAIIGNSGNNAIDGGAGADTLVGGAGADTLAGGKGDDSYEVDAAGDVVTESTNEGIDIVQSAITYVLGRNLENLTLTGSAATKGTGNALNNAITGNVSNNALDGGAGNDSMAGGAGDDTYVVDALGDVVTENASAGTDLVQSSISYVLGSNLENLTLMGRAAINGTGNVLNNAITGNSGNNTLDGGAGNDSMAGGAGDDTYVVNNAGDEVTETSSKGTDLVQSSVTYALTANVENLTLTGSAAISGTGNSDDNVIKGTTGNNTLTGLEGDDTLDGGAGADTLDGGAGDDTYYVDSASDVILESAYLGVDSVLASTTYTLSANIENLTMVGSTNSAGIGNELDNRIVGNIGKNTLVGAGGNDTLDGGAGNDSLVGGTGNDTFIVDSVGDRVTENAKEGTDLVQSSVAFTLSANVERLTLTGTGNINGTGNTLNNSVTGNGGDNRLDGGLGNDTLIGGDGNDTLLGGSGNDSLTGGAGTDVFVFNTTPNATSDFNTITDFVSGTDRINLAQSVMSTLGTVNSALIADAFWQGAGVLNGHDATDRIVYNTSTGALYFDADGSGPGAAVQLAQVGTTASHPASLDFNDFFVF
jgi:serralysin